MRTILFTCGFLITLLCSSQTPKFITVNLIPESFPGACDAQIHIDASRLKQPVQAFFYSGYRIGNELDVAGLCSGAATVIEIVDSACVRVRLNIYISPNPADQVMIDTIYAVLPTTAGASDGSIYFDPLPTNSNTLNIFQKNTGSTYTINTLDSVFTALDEGEYTFMVVDSVLFIDSLEYFEYFMVDVFFESTTPTPCNHTYDFNVYPTPASPGNCDASISMIPTVGVATDYSIIMTGYGAEGYPFVNSTDGGMTFDNYGINICPQPVVVEAVENSGSNSFYYANRVYFLGIDSSGTFSWTPPVIPAGVDTVLFSAIQACAIDYSIPPDTAYIDTLIFIGTNCYLATVVIVQDSITVNSTGIVYADTSGSFIIDFSFYCPDTVFARSGSTEFSSMRNYVYFGDASGTSAVNSLNETSNIVDVFPNPAFNVVNLTSSSNAISRIEILTINGQKVFQLNTKSKSVQIDITEFAPALYVIKYTDDHGKTGLSRLIKF